MAYAVGIDLGTTFTAAAVARDGRVEIVTLGNRTAAAPSVVFLRDDEEMLTGEAAARRGTSDPTRFAREFKRRLGDDTPIMLGRSPYSAERLMAILLQDVLARIAELEGGEAAAVTISHPANWGPFKVELLRQAAALAGRPDATIITEPEAAAIHYAAVERVDPGQPVAVYDLGGGTFDATVLRRTDDGFETLGTPGGIERLGGIDFDAAVFEHVRHAVGDEFEALDQDDRAVASALQSLREECTAAKEALSHDVDASVPVVLPSLHTMVRITRGEFEDMIRPLLRETIAALRRAVESAGVQPEELASVLLVGGSSRIPLVAEMVSQELGRPVAVDAHPKHVVALGAARVAASSGGSAGSPPPGVPGEVEGAETPPAEPSDGAGGGDDGGRGSAPAAAGGAGGRGGGSPRPVLLVGGGVALIVAVVVVIFLLNRDDGTEAGGGGGNDTTSSSTSSSPTSTSSSTTSSTSTSTSTTTAAPRRPTEGVTCDAVSGVLCIDVTDISFDGGGELLITWESNFVPEVDGGNHAHFFLSTFSPNEAGSGGGGSWEVSDVSPHLAGSFDSPALTLAGGRATAPADVDLCVTVANPDHTVRDPAIYQCWEIPGSDGAG